MSVWVTVLVSSALAFGLKYAGHVLPRGRLGGRVQRVTTLLPVALLTGLVVVQAFTGKGGTVVLDSRAAGLAVAVVALLLRAPFLLVVVLAAATAAGCRALGMG